MEIKIADEGEFTTGSTSQLNIAQEVIPSPCRYCLQPLKVGDEVLMVVWRVDTLPELEPIHRFCRP